jgi:hypothetical protein
MKRRGFFLFIVLIFWVCALPQEKQEQNPFEIPFDKVAKSHLKRVKLIVNNHTFVVMLDDVRVRGTSKIYNFLLRELPFTASVVRVLGKGSYDVFKDKGVYYIDDGKGLCFKAVPVYHTQDCWIYYTYGYCKRPLLPRVWCRGVVIIRTWEDKNSCLLIRGKVFARVEGVIEEALAKLMHQRARLSIKARSSLFIQAAKIVSEAIANNPKKFYNKMKDLDKIDKDGLELLKKEFLNQAKGSEKKGHPKSKVQR